MNKTLNKANLSEVISWQARSPKLLVYGQKTLQETAISVKTCQRPFGTGFGMCSTAPEKHTLVHTCKDTCSHVASKLTLCV